MLKRPHFSRRLNSQSQTSDVTATPYLEALLFEALIRAIEMKKNLSTGLKKRVIEN